MYLSQSCINYTDLEMVNNLILSVSLSLSLPNAWQNPQLHMTKFVKPNIFLNLWPYIAEPLMVHDIHIQLG